VTGRTESTMRPIPESHGIAQWCLRNRTCRTISLAVFRTLGTLWSQACSTHSVHLVCSWAGCTDRCFAREFFGQYCFDRPVQYWACIQRRDVGACYVAVTGLSFLAIYRYFDFSTRGIMDFDSFIGLIDFPFLFFFIWHPSFRSRFFFVRFDLTGSLWGPFSA